MKVSFIVLAYKKPEYLRVLIETLLASGSDVYIHYDASSPYDLQDESSQWGLGKYDGCLYHAPRVKVVWGEWSIVQATLNCLNMAREQGYNSDYFMLISGACMPVKPIYELEQFLSENSGVDYIEAVNAVDNLWITDGIQQERWEHYHYINWRPHPKLFSRSLKLQHKLKIKRKLPISTPYIGSQWWCLRQSTIEKVLSLIVKKPKIARFYRRTWVPDESFFQTLVGNLLPEKERSAKLLMQYKFNSKGIPRVYYDDDLAELLAEDAFFARKLAPSAVELRKSLQSICALDKGKYHALLRDPEHTYAQDLYEKIKFDRLIKAIEWFALVSADDNPYEYIKSIPNNIIVVVASKASVKKSMLDMFSKCSDTSVYGDIFNVKKNDFGPGKNKIAGYGVKDILLARHKWYLYLGELAFHAKGKTLVFSLGDEALPYLELLRWKKNFTAIILDEVDSASINYCQSILLNTQCAYLISKSDECSLLRLTYTESIKKNHRQGNDFLDGSLSSVNDYIERLKEYSTKRAWSYFSKTTEEDEYTFLKKLQNPVVVIIDDGRGLIKPVLQQLKSRGDFEIYESVFEVLAEKDLNWHYYFGDLTYLSRKKGLIVTVNLNEIKYLDKLKWKKNLLILSLEKMLTQEPAQVPLLALNAHSHYKSQNNTSDATYSALNACLNEYDCQYEQVAMKKVTPVIDLFLSKLNRNKQEGKLELPKDKLQKLRLLKRRGSRG